MKIPLTGKQGVSGCEKKRGILYLGLQAPSIPPNRSGGNGLRTDHPHMRHTVTTLFPRIIVKRTRVLSSMIAASGGNVMACINYPQHYTTAETQNTPQQINLAPQPYTNGCGSTPMVPFWGRCTAPFGRDDLDSYPWPNHPAPNRKQRKRKPRPGPGHYFGPDSQGFNAPMPRWGAFFGVANGESPPRSTINTWEGDLRSFFVRSFGVRDLQSGNVRKMVQFGITENDVFHSHGFHGCSF